MTASNKSLEEESSGSASEVESGSESGSESGEHVLQDDIDIDSDEEVFANNREILYYFILISNRIQFRTFFLAPSFQLNLLFKI